MKLASVLLSSFALVACTSDGGGGDDDGVDPVDRCGFGSDRYLPFDVGNRWSYAVTDVSSGERKVKNQHLEAGDDGAIVQITGKLAGSTRSVLSVQGDRVVRFQQEDLDSAGVVERTTTYDPGQIRIDEGPDRVVPGARWEEVYDETETEPGSAPAVVRTRDVWEVLDDVAPCESPAGAFTCLHLRRTRAEGGVAVKEFWFARGVGKIRERGDSVVEELASCGR